MASASAMSRGYWDSSMIRFNRSFHRLPSCVFLFSSLFLADRSVLDNRLYSRVLVSIQLFSFICEFNNKPPVQPRPTSIDPLFPGNHNTLINQIDQPKPTHPLSGSVLPEFRPEYIDPPPLPINPSHRRIPSWHARLWTIFTTTMAASWRSWVP